MLHLALVFIHLVAASMALGAIVATDLRLLSKLAQDRVRIAPPNAFVARIVTLSLLLLIATGAAIVWLGTLERADYLDNPKLQAKILLVALLTANAFVLHRVSFPRLARGRRVARWRPGDWVAIGVPVAVSNFLWLFAAFLGVARPWNYDVPLRDILELAAGLFLVVQCLIFAVLAMAGGVVDPQGRGVATKVRRTLATLGNLGRAVEPADDEEPPRRRRSRSSSRARAGVVPAMAGGSAAPGVPLAVFAEPAVERVTATGRPLRLVDRGEPPPALERTRAG